MHLWFYLCTDNNSEDLSEVYSNVKEVLEGKNKIFAAADICISYLFINKIYIYNDFPG